MGRSTWRLGSFALCCTTLSLLLCSSAAGEAGSSIYTAAQREPRRSSTTPPPPYPAQSASPTALTAAAPATPLEPAATKPPKPRTPNPGRGSSAPSPAAARDASQQFALFLPPPNRFEPNPRGSTRPATGGGTTRTRGASSSVAWRVAAAGNSVGDKGATLAIPRAEGVRGAAQTVVQLP